MPAKATVKAEFLHCVVSNAPVKGKVSAPSGVCVYRADAKSKEYTLLVADLNYGCLRQRLADGRVLVIAGKEGESGFKNGAAMDSQFDGLSGVCVDPTNPNRIFLSDQSSVRLLDRTNSAGGGGGGAVSLIAGGAWMGCADGVGPKAEFRCISDLVCTSDGQTLITANGYNCRIRSIDIKTGAVTTVAGDGKDANKNGVGVKASLSSPLCLAFDTTTAAPDSVLFIGCTNAIVRFERHSGDVRAIAMDWKVPLAPNNMACTPNGTVLFTCRDTHSLYSCNPTNGQTALLAGSGAPGGSGNVNGSGSDARFDHPTGIALIDSDQSLMLADYMNRLIRCVTLPPQLFTAVKAASSAPPVLAPTATTPVSSAALTDVKSTPTAAVPASASPLPSDVRVWTSEHVIVWASKTEMFKPFLAALRELDGTALVFDADESWLTQTFPSVIARNRMRREIIELRTAHGIDLKRAAPLTGGGGGGGVSPVAVASDAVDVKSPIATAALNLDDLGSAACTVTAIPKSADRFDEIEKEFRASIGLNDDYVANRTKAGKKPIAFRLLAAHEITNSVLNARFERERNRLKALNRTADELKVKTAFHGTRESCLMQIAKTGLLRVGHALNPSHSTDPGWFGSPKHGVYLSRHSDYALKYSNELKPLEPSNQVKVLMFKLVSGKSFHVLNKTNGMLPTAGYDSHSSANYLEWFLFDESMCVPTHILTVESFEDQQTDSDDKSFKG